MLSIETLYFSSTVSRTTILFIFAVLLFSQPHARYLWYWSSALLCSGMGTVLSFYYADPSGHSSLLDLFIMILFLASIATSWAGLRCFYGRSTHLLVVAMLVFLPTSLYAFGVQAGMSVRATLAFYCLSAASLAAITLVEILKSPDRRILSQYVVALSFAVYTVVLAVSAILIMAGRLAADASTSAITPMAFDQAASVLVYFGYIAMTGERAALELQRQAETDPLTGLANRRAGNRLLEKLHCDASDDEGYSVLIGDVDHFKQINDSLGHEAGDKVLNLFAERLRTCMRKRDNAVRWGGEEFLIILPGTAIDEAEQLGERLLREIAATPFMIDQQSIAMTLSLGIAMYRSSDSSFEVTVMRADQALYRAKQEGRNRINR